MPWPGESHGPYSPWGRRELDTTEQLSLTIHRLDLDSQCHLWESRYSPHSADGEMESQRSHEGCPAGEHPSQSSDRGSLVPESMRSPPSPRRSVSAGPVSLFTERSRRQRPYTRAGWIMLKGGDILQQHSCRNPGTESNGVNSDEWKQGDLVDLGLRGKKNEKVEKIWLEIKICLYFTFFCVNFL